MTELEKWRMYKAYLTVLLVWGLVQMAVVLALPEWRVLHMVLLLVAGILWTPLVVSTFRKPSQGGGSDD